MMANIPQSRSPRRQGWRVLALLLILSQLVALSGCTRRFFRRRSDADADLVLAQKDRYPGWWKLQSFWVYPHPLSRFADPTDPDRPPMPPDDPAAWDLSPHPQRPWIRGYRYWEGTGYLDLMRKWDIENRTRKQEALEAEKEKNQEEGEEPLLPGENKTFAERAREVDNQIERELNSPVTATAALPEALGAGQGATAKPFMLNLEQVTELGFINSREFQTIREQLYLTALTVTAERFAFIAQPFVAEQVVRERSGARSIDGQTNRWVSNTTTGVTKAFSTGALLLLNFANQTVYNLGAGPTGTTSVSTINFDFIQPFLVGGGRAVALEPLTQAERNLVYAIRDFYRFRQEYFVFFAAGQSTGFIPGVGAGVVAISPATTLQPAGFIPTGGSSLGVAGGGLGGLSFLSPNPASAQVSAGQGGGARPNLGAGILVTPQGYLSAVQERAVLVNYYKNIQNLQRFLRLFEKYLEGGLVNQVQKGQVEQQLLASIENVLGQQANYRVSLDQLKQQLGLPITVPIELDPAPLQPMINLIDGYEKLSIDFERVAYNGLLYGRSSEARQLRQRLRTLLDRTPLMRGTKTRERTLTRVNYYENLGKGKTPRERQQDLEAILKDLRGKREALLQQQRTVNPGEPLPEAAERAVGELTFEIDLASYEYYLSIYEVEPWATEKDPIRRADLANIAFRRVYSFLLLMVDRAFVERQLAIKEQWPALPPVRAEGVDLLSASDEEALAAVERTTLNYRVDLMNVRAQLTDSWRKIRVAANALMGTFNVDYHLDASSPAGGSNPFAIGGSRTRHQLIFNMTPPIVRVLQRNNYRSTLISFQQFRRNLIGYEDQLVFNSRFNLRQIRLLANNYQRVQKRQIELAYMQVDQALQAFSQPQAPVPTPGLEPQGLVGPVAQRPQVGDPAALTNQLLTTQASLLRSQNDLYNTWITYVIDRMNLYRDMGVMPLDNRGVWIDDAATTSNAPDNNRQPAGEQRPSGPAEQLPPPRPERNPQPGAQPLAQGPALETRQ